jgi:predicted Zn-dependent protease
VLVGTHHGDRSVLMISGGYGVQSAGEAISQSLRALATPSRSYPVLIAGNLIGVLTHALCLVIWWRAVASENAQRAARPLTGVSSEE